jgi:HEAT repeat protein
MDPNAGENSREALHELEERRTIVPRRNLQTILREHYDAGARMMAAEMLAEQMNAEAAPELQETARRDRAWAVRAAALSALASIRGPRAVPELKKAMGGDVDPQVRLTALRELHGLLTQRREDELTNLLDEALTDPEPVVRLQASRYLAQLTGLNAAPDLRSWQQARSQ